MLRNWKFLPAVFVALLTTALVSGSAVIVAPPRGTVTYPEVIAGVGSDGAGGFIVVVPFNMTASGTPVVPGAWIGDFYPNGSLKWGEYVKGFPFRPSPRVLRATANGSILLVGQSDAGNHTDIWVIKLEGDGRLRWSKDYLLNVSPGWIMFIDNVVQMEDEILIATHVDSFGGDGRVTAPVVLALDGSGNPLWAGAYQIPHGPRELYSTAIGKVKDGYYLILHDEETWYYVILDKNGNPLETWKIISPLEGFFIKSALSVGDTVYFLGGSSNGTVLGAIAGNSTAWARLYTLSPEKTCTEKSGNVTLLSSETFSTEPAPVLTVSEGHLIFQPAVVKAFRLTCSDGLNTTYALIKTDRMGTVVDSFTVVTEGKEEDMILPGNFGEPEGISANGDSFIALWRETISSGPMLQFRSFAIVSNLKAKPKGPAIEAYSFQVKTTPTDVKLIPGSPTTKKKLTIKVVEGQVTVKRANGIPVRVISVKDSSEKSICGPGISILLLLLVALWKRR